MVACSLCFTVLFIGIVAAQDPQAQFQRPPSSAVSGTTGFTLGKEYNVNAGVQKDGTLSGSAYASIGGKVGPGPNYYNPNSGSGDVGPARDVANSGYYAQYSDPQGPYPASAASSSSLWSPANVNYYVAGGVFGAVVVGYGLYSFFASPLTLKKIAAGMAGDEEEEEAGVAGVVPDSKKDTKVASKKTRRRRTIRRDEDAARLASIVLSAVESGECLQKSICLMGSQIGGTEKGKLALTLLQKLVPKSIQGNHYFTTLQNALEDGEITCDPLNCTHKLY